MDKWEYLTWSRTPIFKSSSEHREIAKREGLDWRGFDELYGESLHPAYHIDRKDLERWLVKGKWKNWRLTDAFSHGHGLMLFSDEAEAPTTTLLDYLGGLGWEAYAAGNGTWHLKRRVVK